jgi:hypothetical protein
MVHGTNELAWTLLLVLALGLHGAVDAVAGRRSGLLRLLKELLLAALVVMGLLRPLLLRRGLLLGRRRLLRVMLLRRSVLLAGLVLATAPAAAMPLRLSLTVGLGRPHFRLGLSQICRHACTSWCIANLMRCLRCLNRSLVGRWSTCAARIDGFLGDIFGGQANLQEYFQTA